MHDLCMVRIINAESEEKALNIVSKCCDELCAEYRTADYGVEVVREIKACEFLSIYEKKEITNDQVEDWMKNNKLEDICDNFTQDNLDDDVLQKITDLWGEEFSSCMYVDKIDATLDKETNEWIFKLYFDICPITCLWDYAYPVKPNEVDYYGINLEGLEDGVVSNISKEFENNKRACMAIIFDATKEKNEYGRLMPIWKQESSDRLSISDTYKDYPKNDNDYIYYLGCKF